MQKPYVIDRWGKIKNIELEENQINDSDEQNIKIVDLNYCLDEGFMRQIHTRNI